MGDKLDVFGTRPLHHLNRFSLIIQLRQTQAELRVERQKVKDLQGALDAMSLGEPITTGAIRSVIEKTKL